MSIKTSGFGHGWPIYDFKAVIAGYNYVGLTQTSTTDTWTYKMGGSAGTTLATVTITYTDTTKATIDHVDVA
jgi:hypothetical protein